MTPAQSLFKRVYWITIFGMALNLFYIGMDSYKFVTLQKMTFGGIPIPEPWGVLVLALDTGLFLISYRIFKRSRKLRNELKWR